MGSGVAAARRTGAAALGTVGSAVSAPTCIGGVGQGGEPGGHWERGVEREQDRLQRWTAGKWDGSTLDRDRVRGVRPG
jgi:hypothetical protein